MSHSRRPKDVVTHIGDHKLDPATMMMGYGFDPALSEGSLKAPIFLTSTFVFETAADGKRFFEGITNKHGSGGKAEGLVYSRFNGPNQEILEGRLALWEEAESALTFSSGMTAIAILLLTFVRPGDVVVHSGPLYAATETIINKILSQFGVHYVDFPAGATREELDAVMAAAKAQGAGVADLPRKPGQSDQRAGRCRGGCGGARGSVRRGGRASADRHRQHVPGAAVGQADRAGRGHLGLLPDQICRRA